MASSSEEESSNSESEAVGKEVRIVSRKGGYELLSQMRKDPKLCDVTLIVEGHEFKAHRAVLAAANPYFSVMFTNGMRESQPKDSDRIYISDVDKKSFRFILDFVYSGEVVFETKDTALPLLKAADMLQLFDLVELIVEEMVPIKLELSECVDLWNHADQCNLFKLQKSALSFLEKNFGEFTLDPSLERCPRKLLFLLLNSDNVLVRTELTILDGIINWIDFDIDQRSADFQSALSRIRLARMNSRDLGDLLEAVYLSGESSRSRGESSKFRKAVLQRLHRQSQKEALMGVIGAFRSSLYLEFLSPLCRRDQIPVFFAQELKEFSSKVMKIDSSWINDPEGGLEFRFSVDPQQEINNNENLYISAFLHVRRQVTC